MISLEHSLFFIKPEAIEYKKQILAKISGKPSFLDLVALKEVVFTQEHIKALYWHVPESVMRKLTDQLLGKTCAVGVVRGANAIRSLVEICGEQTFATHCNLDSVRYMYGNHRREYMHLNAIHRPTTEEEAKANLILFGFTFT